MKFSFFKSAKSKTGKPDGSLTIEQLIAAIREGSWKKEVLTVRQRSESKAYRLLKEKLPAVTISGTFKTRDVEQSVEDRLIAHSGYIGIDIDGKDNPKLRVKDLVDKDALAQFISPGGKGIKQIYRCKPVKTAAEHRRIFDAIVERLAKKGITIKVDPVVKSIASLQFVSYDPEAYYNPKTKLVVSPLPPKKIAAKKHTHEGDEQLKQLDEYIDALGKKDVTATYEDWLNILFGLSYSFGEAGRERAQRLCSNYPGYSAAEVDEKFDACLESTPSATTPITVSTVFQLVAKAIPAKFKKALGKKYIKTHAVAKGKAEDVVDNPDLAGFVRYGLFLFKKIVDKKTQEVVDLQLSKLNLNEFEKALRTLGFYRYQAMYEKTYFVHIVENIVTAVDADDILRIFTSYVEGLGDVAFTYNEIPYTFRNEEVALFWRDKRTDLKWQIAPSLTHWLPNLLKDTVDTSFIPYRNGVVKVTKKDVELVPYKSIPYQIWKERILPRDFKYSKGVGEFEKFWVNVFGTGNTRTQQISSPSYKRATWYYGYCLQGTKRASTARAWILYDIKTGNNGRTGKTIVAKAIGKIRNLTIIDGKRTDLTDRFALQMLDPWTEVCLIDDVARGASLQPLFSAITGDTVADKKGVTPLTVSVKFIFTANWFLESEGSSETGRQFVSQVNDYYLRYSKEHGNTITPIVDAHAGKEFFTDWDAGDWSTFDSFSIRALQTYLGDDRPENTIIGDAKILRFIQTYEEEVFFNLARTLVETGEDVEEGIIVSTSAMSEAVKEANEGINSKRAGMSIRSFFAAIDAEYAGITTAKGTNGLTRNVYKLGKNWKNLAFGPYADRLSNLRRGRDFRGFSDLTHLVKSKKGRIAAKKREK